MNSETPSSGTLVELGIFLNWNHISQNCIWGRGLVRNWNLPIGTGGAQFGEGGGGGYRVWCVHAC